MLEVETQVETCQSYAKGLWLGRYESCDIEEIELLVVVVRKIWFKRNIVAYIWGDFTHPNQVFQEVVNSLDEFRRVHSKEDEKGVTNKE